MTRVAVVDDHSRVREALRALLATVAEPRLVASAATADEAVEVAITERADVLVLDLGLPDGSGIDVARTLRQVAPDTAVPMLTMHDDADSVFAAMRAGAKGYVLKGAEPDDVIRAIQDVAAGLGNAAIASRLGGSPNTVANRVTSIFAELQVATVPRRS